MNPIPLFTALMLAFISAQAQSFRLASERRETYGVSGAKSETFTAYDYDAGGNRSGKRTFLGPDGGGTGLGTTAYIYGLPGRIDREVSVIGSDTVSVAEYVYGLSSEPTRINVRGPGGKLRYSDLFAYDSLGRLIAEGRLAADATPMHERHYAYDGSARLAFDSLFEMADGALKNTQIRSLTYNGDGTVAGEAHARLSGSDWMIWKNVKMYYAGGRLAAAVDFEGARRMDSVAYGYDGAGNRSELKRIDDEGNLAEAVYYTWQALTVSVRGAPAAGRFERGRPAYNLLGRLMGKAETTFNFQEPK
jgi:hypothetical protein